MKYLSRNSIIEALETRAAELVPEDVPHELLIAGGAALVLLYDARASTKDVDAILSDSVVREAARRVAERLELPDNWLNGGAKGFAHGLASGEVLLQTPTLVVRALAPQQLLAMKLCAWRDDLDICDARLLLSRLQGGKEHLWKEIEPYLVPGRELKARYAFEDLWESEHGAS